jgi:hypothetical protein
MFFSDSGELIKKIYSFLDREKLEEVYTIEED